MLHSSFSRLLNDTVFGLNVIQTVVMKEDTHSPDVDFLQRARKPQLANDESKVVVQLNYDASPYSMGREGRA